MTGLHTHNFILRTILITFVLLWVTPLRAEMLEDVVQEIETLIEQNYKGRAKKIAMGRLDRLLSQDLSEAESIKQLKAYRDRLVKSGAIPAKPSVVVKPKVDSDGDGTEDSQDSTPLLANNGDLRWKLQSVSLSVRLLAEGAKTESFVFSGWKSSPSGPVKPVTHPVTLMGLDWEDQSDQGRLKLASANSLYWGTWNRQTAAACIARLVRLVESRQPFEAFVSFDIMLQNHSKARDLYLTKGPVSLSLGKVTLTGACTEIDNVIKLPKRATRLLRFASKLTEKDLSAFAVGLQKGSPLVSVESGKLRITDKAGNVRLVEQARVILKKTHRISITTPEGRVSWQVARRRGDDRISLHECLAAINMQAVMASKKPIFELGDKGVVSVAGLANSAKAQWVMVSQGEAIVDAARAVKLPMSGDIDFMLVVRSVVVADLEAYQSVLLKGGDTARLIRSLSVARIQDWRLATSLGWAEGTFLLARCYGEGAGVVRNYRRALTLHNAAAELGSLTAMNRLGEILSSGRGIDIDEGAAVQWFTKAAEGGDAAAQDNLARKFYYGLGVKQNAAVAFQWFQKAANQNHVHSLNSLGWAYLNGIGTQVNHELARAAYEKAAILDYAPAMSALGRMCVQGLGGKADVQGGLKWLQQAVKRGDATANYQLGVFLRRGQHLSQDYGLALNLLRRAAAAGNVEAMIQVGQMYELGQSVPANQSEALKYYIKAAEQGSLAGITQLGHAYKEGIGVDPDPKKALKFYAKAADQAHVEAQIGLGKLYLDSELLPIPDRYERAQEWFRKAMQKRSARAEAHIGSMYELGQGVKKSTERAIKHYTAAADRGDAMAQTRLAMIHDIRKEYHEAAKLYAEAAKQGYPTACHGLALYYLSGTGVPKDEKRFLALLQKAASGGFYLAQSHLGILYLKGDRIPKNLLLAKEWLLKAAHQGESVAQSNLGRMYEEGLGVRKDLSIAKQWYASAAKQDDKYAIQALKRLVQ